MATKPSKHSSATPTSAPRTSSGSSARSNVLKNRTALLSHCKAFASGRNAIKLRNAIDSAIEHFKFLRQRPDRRIETGEKIVQQSGQRRRIKTYTPALPTGRRPKHDERYLVSAIASAYIRFADQEVTQNREGAKSGPTPFEQLLYPILKELKIFDPREKLSNHLKRRRTPFAPLDVK